MTSLQYPLLALDTSGVRASVAVATLDSVNCAVSVAHNGHSQTVLTLADEMLLSAEIDRSAIRTLVVVHGPGSFTGLRVAVSLAQGIVLASGCELIAVDALLATAWHALQQEKVEPGRIVLVAHDARLGEIYAAVFRWTGEQCIPLGSARLAAAHDICKWFEHCAGEPLASGSPPLAAGSAWLAFEALSALAMRRAWKVDTEAFPRADAAILASRYSTEMQVSRLETLEQLQPVYLRNKVALNSREQEALRWRKQFSALRAAQASEVDQLASLEASLQPTPWSAQSFAQAISSGGVVQALGLVSNPSQLLAYFVLLPVVDEMQLLNLGVAGPWQGKGLGRWLLEQAIILSKVMGMSSMLLEVRQSNQVARTLYEQMGFVQVGLRRAYYATASGSREDAMVMRLRMTEHAE